MCFVSFLPQPGGFLLGSNRDEHYSRNPAIPPRMYLNPFVEMVMPLDGKAGGTWISLRNDGVAAVLLNGAFVNHTRQPAYRHSRGIIIPKIMDSPDPNDTMAVFNFENIEPFTLIVVNGLLTEWRWDGNQLHCQTLDSKLPHCWSSATLYNNDQQALRKQWFMDAIHNGTIYNARTLLHWQVTGGYGPSDTDIVLQRDDGIQTVSTTVVSSFENDLQMVYEDYLSPVPKLVSIPARFARHEEKKSF